MGAPKGNQNAAGLRKRSNGLTRFQNVSTMITSVMKDGKSRTLKPRMVIALSDEDIQESKDSHIDPDRNPFSVGLVVEIPEGNTSHPDAPKEAPRVSPDKLKELVSEGSIDDIEKMIQSFPDSGGIQTMHKVLIELGDSLNKKRRELVEEMIDDKGDELSKKNKKSRRQYKERVG